MDNSLTKKERLCGKSVIAELFNSKNTLFSYPFRCVWSVVSDDDRVSDRVDDSPNSGLVSVLFSVPKRKIKRANRRNLLKRRMKESYRLNKHNLVEYARSTNIQLNVALLYVATDVIDYHKIEEAVKTLLIEIEKNHK